MNSDPTADGLVWSAATPAGRSGAIAGVDIVWRGADRPGAFEAALAGLGLPCPAVGGASLASLFGVDEGVVIRWAEGLVTLTPHAGRAVLRALAERLESRGVPRAETLEPAERYPEAADPIGAMALAAAAEAPSPLAIDLLLDQPRRWAGVGDPQAVPEERLADGRVLGRLLRPPVVAAVGAANIGKSTLLNALAGRSVAVVADEPGTTRDRVGAALELDGLAVRYLDTPGLRARGVGKGVGAIERAAVASALEAVAREADLVLLCGDPGTPPPRAEDGVVVRAGAAVLRVCLRRDLGAAAWGGEPGPDVEVAAGAGDGAGGGEELARAVRRTLVPDAVLRDPRPWRFWAGVVG